MRPQPNFAFLGRFSSRPRLMGTVSVICSLAPGYIMSLLNCASGFKAPTLQGRSLRKQMLSLGEIMASKSCGEFGQDAGRLQPRPFGIKLQTPRTGERPIVRGRKRPGSAAFGAVGVERPLALSGSFFDQSEVKSAAEWGALGGLRSGRGKKS